jgi:hypothetical protein
MGKKFFVLLLTSLFFVSVALAAPDLGIGPGGLVEDVAKGGGLNTQGVTDTTLSETIGRYINIALGFVGIVFFLLTLYAGYLWMFGGGNEENIAKAKKIFTSSVIGLIIVLTSYSITALVMYYLFRTAAPVQYENEFDSRTPSVSSGCCLNKKTDKGYFCTENIGAANCNKLEGSPNWRSKEACSLFSCYDYNSGI